MVVFIRGVNVGGHRTFRPSVLAAQLAKHNVINLGAAGTFIVLKPISEARLRVELLRRMPFDAEIMICSGSDVINLTSGNPFRDQPSARDVVPFVSVLAKSPSMLPAIPLSLPANGDWQLKILEVRGRFVFGLYRRTMRAITLLNQLEKHLGASVTTRNWNTVNAIVKILKSNITRGRV